MMNGYIDDNKPFFRKAKDIADRIETNRKARIESNRASGTGTLKGLEDIIARRKQEVSRAK